MTLLILLLPFLGTSLGASIIFLFKNDIKLSIKTYMLSFSAGIMLASAIFSLLVPSLSYDANNYLLILSFFLGIVFLFLIDYIFPEKDYQKSMLLSVNIHNIPEGLAVGIICSLALYSSSITLLDALIFSLGITIQNIPEGSIISFPSFLNGDSKFKAFFKGVFSGAIEPISSIVALLLIKNISFIMPYLLMFASGTMFFVTLDKIIPEYKKDPIYKNVFWGFTLGFILMMSLDLLL